MRRLPRRIVRLVCSKPCRLAVGLRRCMRPNHRAVALQPRCQRNPAAEHRRILAVAGRRRIRVVVDRRRSITNRGNESSATHSSPLHEMDDRIAMAHGDVALDNRKPCVFERGTSPIEAPVIPDTRHVRRSGRLVERIGDEAAAH